MYVVSKTYEETTVYHQAASELRRRWMQAQKIVSSRFAAGDYPGMQAACDQRDAIAAEQRSLRAAYLAAR